jgi:hypothetical protein
MHLQSQRQVLGPCLTTVSDGFQQQQHYDFRYEDEDNVFEEINEFYAFVEADQLGENLRLWQGSFDRGSSKIDIL